MAVDWQTFNLKNLESEMHPDYAFEDILASLKKKKTVINFYPQVRNSFAWKFNTLIQP